MSGWLFFRITICPGDICPGKELFAVFHRFGDQGPNALVRGRCQLCKAVVSQTLLWLQITDLQIY